MRKHLIIALALCAGVCIMIRPAELSGAVRNSLEGCLEVVIPALFAFTVLAVSAVQRALPHSAPTADPAAF